jgi:DNA replication and repair protein RecF
VRLAPLQVLNADAFQLLTGGPGERREFMDWGLFHVEHEFLDLWKRYRRYLEQRNAALRGRVHAGEMSHWEQGLADCGEALAAMRERYIQEISPLFAKIFTVLLEEEAPRLIYRRGWPKDHALIEVLERNRASERVSGYTMAGPHRADLRLVTAEGLDAADSFSRGQQKLAVCALRLAQMQYLQNVAGRRCTLLLDDLPAELDQRRRHLLMQSVASSGAQCLVTATDRNLLDLSPWNEAAVFHVEHGVVTEVV